MNIKILNINKILKSERKAIKDIEPLMFEIRRSVKINDQKFYNMLIAVTEAVNNAIVHGNRCDPEKKVSIIVQGFKEYVMITIEDEGNGFDPDSVADPRAPENLMKEHGRGVFLIKQLSEFSEFTPTVKGTKITMKFLTD